jgi:hypothetical protein
MIVPSRLLGIIAAFATLLLVALAASGAQAHAGHSHASVAAQQPEAQNTYAARPTVVEMRVHVPSAAHVHDVDNCADRGCCGNGHCSACCSVLVPASLVQFGSTADASPLIFDAETPPGLATDGPPRPPRFFA